MPEEVEVPAVLVDTPHGMGVGDVTGPLGMVLAVVLGLDKFGLLRRGNEKPPEAVLAQRDKITRLEADVRHLQDRLQEHRSAHEQAQARTAASLESIRDDIRREINRER
tara:strand:- start:100 stop:426 length:327 start_codon:yes stop_codon:yes gene_type:complete